MSDWFKDDFKEKIEKAKLCKLDSLFKAYNLNISKTNNKVTCPFKSHKGGRENSASFYFYPNTNSYWCFGCKQGSNSIDFVKFYENCSFSEAVEKINNLDKIKFIQQETKYEDSFKKKLKFAELICKNKRYDEMKVYDQLIDKYDLDEESISIVLDKLISKMEG